MIIAIELYQLYTLCILTNSDTRFAHYFDLFYRLPFNFVDSCTLPCRSLLVSCSPTYLFLLFLPSLGCQIQNLTSKTNVKEFTNASVFSYNCYGCSLTFKSLIHFALILVYGVK